jgi:hypothetical protein
MTRTLIDTFPHATQVKVMRRRVMQHDLDLYAAISGKPPEMEPAGESTEHSIRVATAARAKPWSTAVLAGYLGQLSMPRRAVRAVKPEVADWLRRLSSHAVERLQEAQVRLASNRQTRP